MLNEPRSAEDYPPRQVEAARRVIVDVMQTLASFKDCIVLVGGWVPDLLIDQSEEPHIGSIDVDLVLDAKKLNDGRYASMLELLVKTRRYQLGEKPFQFVTEVDLDDGQPKITVEVEFLAPQDVKTEKNIPKLIEGFRVLKADGCAAAFNSPITRKLEGWMASGASNTVSLQIASIPDFLIMKTFALDGREKPKDAYDICYCLDNYEDGINGLADAWNVRYAEDGDVRKAVTILGEKFSSTNSFGPQQVVAFHNETNSELRAQQARRAYELVKRFLEMVENPNG